MSQPVRAVDLNGTNLDSRVKFEWHFDSGIKAVVEGTVREIHHHSEGVTIWLAGIGGNNQEFTIANDTTIQEGTA